MTRRSALRAWTEPLWWCLFSAGGLCAAIVVPPAVLLLGLGPGWLPEEALAYARIQKLFAHPAALVFVLTAIVLPTAHAFYRIRHSMHDLQLGRASVVSGLCAALALLISGLALAAWMG